MVTLTLDLHWMGDPVWLILHRLGQDSGRVGGHLEALSLVINLHSLGSWGEDRGTATSDYWQDVACSEARRNTQLYKRALEVILDGSTKTESLKKGVEDRDVSGVEG